ncbi:MAG: HEAT repeat domain-containing protein, partial [Polyangiaceae bacterium]|nr:HEAT repeat domain-containing protein [Polyangiaceae bacterium]
MTAGYAEVDLVQARSHGRELASSGKLQQARQVLLAGLAQTYALEEDYAPALDLLAQVLWQEGDARGALTCAWYLGDDRLAGQAGERVVAEDRARTFVGQALRSGRSGANVLTYYEQAARQFEAAGRIAQAAVCRERAEQHAVARPLWSRLCHAIGQSTDGDLYAAALARFNLARTSRRVGDMRTAREATVASVHLLEQAADRYESVGQRERAFDCYQVLAAIGRDSGTVEHALEGFINLTRILREDQLRSYALREYGNAIRFLRERGEVAAAATLASEMAQYARREGLVAVANNAVLEQAGMWRELAQGILQRNGPVEIAENALLAAVLSYAELGQFSRAGAAYLELAHLPLEQARRTQYARASARYHGARDEALDAVRSPDVGRRDDALHDVWHVDLIEWEHSGSAAEVCADVIVDVETWSDVIRRRALLARLVALPLEGSSVPVAAQDWQRLVDALAPTELYVTLSPLEHL